MNEQMEEGEIMLLTLKQGKWITHLELFKCEFSQAIRTKKRDPSQVRKPKKEKEKKRTFEHE